MKRKLLGLFMLLGCTLNLTAGAAPMSSWVFRVLKTDHFEIVFRQEQKALAKRYAVAAEQAYELLFPIFKEAPSTTIIVISDETDASNGMATFLPYPIIYVYPVLPSTLDSIDEYGDWPLEMIVHEYTHILNMYPSHSFYVPLRWIFGSVVRPNAILPKWYLEGLAVNLESRLTDHGRLRASETSAAARVLISGQRLRGESIARINEQELQTWPYGSRPYLFGGWWWNQVQSERGAGVIETWNQNFSRRIPFLLNGPMREQSERSAEELLDSTYSKLETEVSKQLVTLNRAPTQPSVAIAKAEDGEQSVFAMSPSGKRLVFWASSTQTKGSVAYVKERTTATQPLDAIVAQKLFKALGSLRVQWLGEDSFVYDQIDVTQPNVSYRDLYLYDFVSHSSRRLTSGQRAQDATPTPSGTKIAFIQNDGGRNHLMLLDVASGDVKPLIHGGFSQRLSSPLFLSESELLFVDRSLIGLEQIHALDLSTRKIRIWNDDLGSVQHLRLTAKGVLATNADSGVRNVYFASPIKGQSRALSNSLSDIQTADYDRSTNSVLASELTPFGRRLVTFPYASYSPPKIETTSLEIPPKAATAKVKFREESYQPIKYLLPRYWIPFVYPVENGVLFQGTTDNADPAGRNKYSLFGSYDTLTRKPSYGISYVNSSLPTDIGLSYAKTVSYLGASAQTVESQSTGASLSNYWPFNNRFTRWSIGGQSSQTQSATSTYRRQGPTAGLQYSRLDHPLNNWLGWHASVAHEEYLAGGNATAYGHSTFHLAQNIQLGGGHGFTFHQRGAFAPKMNMGDVTDLGDRSIGGNYLVSLTNSDYLLRGYPSGSFVGRKILSANFEYSFPLVKTIGGYGTFPLFLRDLDMALFYDALSVDGGAWDVTRLRYFRSYLSRFYSGAGFELRVNSTAAYHLPISLILGGYYGFSDRFGGGFTPFVGIGMGSLGALENKTP